MAGRCRARLAAIFDQLAGAAGNYARFLGWLRAAGDDHLGYVLGKLAGKDLGPGLSDIRARLVELRAAAVPLEAALAQKLLPLVQERAARRKREAGLFDFDDMLALVDEALADPARRAAP